MDGYLRRLAASGLAYQASSLLAALLALFTLPLYTRHLTPGGVRLRRDAADARDPDEHPAARRHGRGVRAPLVRRRGRRAPRAPGAHDDGFVARHARRCALIAGVLLAGPLSRLMLGTRDATLMAFGVVGIWTFTNLEMAYALLRVEERRRAYMRASRLQRAC